MKSNLSQTITGGLIIAIGVLFLLSNLDILHVGDILRDWWPLIIIVTGIVIFINDTKSYLWALLVVGFGAILQVNQLDIININVWQLFWPVVMIVIGISIIRGKIGETKKITAEDGDDISAILGGSDRINTSDDFKASNITSVMGGVKFDIRKATIKKDATIRVFALLGGIEIVVPRSVRIKNQTSAILGGIEDKTDQDLTKNSPTLTIIGDVVLAGVEVKN